MPANIFSADTGPAITPVPVTYASTRKSESNRANIEPQRLKPIVQMSDSVAALVKKTGGIALL